MNDDRDKQSIVSLLSQLSSESSSFCISSSDSLLSLKQPTPYYQPILTQDARTKTNTISMFNDDELVKYFPEHKITVYIGTWNMASRQPPEDMNPFVLPESVEYLADVLVFGTQEAPQGDFFDEWEIELQKTIGPSHVMFHSTQHGALHLAIFVRRFLIWYCSSPEEETHNTTSPCAVPFLKTKGCIAVSFRIFGTSFLFINSHFPAHESQIKSRLEEYESVISNVSLPKDLSYLKPKYLTGDLTGRFDYAFWFGDLNFRIDLPWDEVDSFLYEYKLHKSSFEDGLNYILNHDQLYVSMKKYDVFRGFNEAPITFFPTYKFKPQTDIYDLHEKRVPSYTDRILYKTKRLGQIINYQYDCVSDIQTSDHRPVFGLFEAKLRERKDDVPFNAGQFNRNVYIEGLKQRAHDVGRTDVEHQECVLS